ncbi:hypothetical protein [Comamonas sp. GB3 AK4-5]|uniref:hypothetical protein n=1 Tax=Comamonas sp. GB3 AK4-5 TaxID=3231487 RepID=UPI00351E5CE2
MRFSPFAAASRRASWHGGLAAAVWLAAACAGATSLPVAPTGPLATIRIVERASGKVLPVYRHQGEYWVAGRPGANYAVRVHNTTDDRIMGVISVDGLNVLTGKRAAARPDDGYVFDAGEAADIAGWRKSLDKVAAFYFSESDMSYASRTGRPQDVGVIGVALFREKALRIAYQPNDRSSYESSARSNSAESAAAADMAAPRASASSAPAMRQAEKSAPRSAPAAPTPSLGTGHGAIETSHVSTTSVDSATARPEQLVHIRYDSYANLVAKGVIPKPPPPRVQRKPRPFPDDGFVVDPPAQ